MNDFQPEILKALNIIDMPLQSCMEDGKSAWGLVDWVVVPILKKGDQKVCSNCWRITLLSLPGKAYGRVFQVVVKHQLQEEQCGSCSGHGNSGLTLAKLLQVIMGVCISSVHVFCEFGEGMIMFISLFLHRVSGFSLRKIVSSSDFQRNLGVGSLLLCVKRS